MTPSPLYEEDVYSPLDHHPQPKDTMLIGLHGHAQSGKNTSGDILTEERGYEQISFAEPVKQLAWYINPVVRVDAYGGVYTLQDVVLDLGWEAAKEVGSTREFLQRLGVGVREVVGDDVWVKIAMRKVKEGGKYAFTDTRFPNEADAILRRNGVIIEVWRPGVGPVNDHVSDKRLPDHLITRRVYNDRDIAGLKDDLLATVEHLSAA